MGGLKKAICVHCKLFIVQYFKELNIPVVLVATYNHTNTCVPSEVEQIHVHFANWTPVNFQLFQGFGDLSLVNNFLLTRIIFSVVSK